MAQGRPAHARAGRGIPRLAELPARAGRARRRRLPGGLIRRLYRLLRGAGRKKRASELAYWRAQKDAEGTLGNEHYRMLFTDLFGLDGGFYAGKGVLDIGCGPRGSLEWANEAARRVGLDPLADDLARTVAEIKRVTRAGGHFLLAVEVGHDPTWTEPQSLTWDACKLFQPEFEIGDRSEYERDSGWMFDAALRREHFDRSESSPRPGVLTAVMRRR